MEGRSYYKRFYRLVAVAVAVMTAVLTGSLVLGDSVRGSLMARVAERLGDAETLVQTGTGFLSDSILQRPLLSSARGYLMAEGFVSVNGQMQPVTVWGTDADSIAQGEALINSSLFPFRSSFPIVLHLPSTSLVPSGSLFVSDRYSTQLRLHVKGVKSAADGGNLWLRNEQVRPCNIFVNRQQLAEALGVRGKVNIILSPAHFTTADFAAIWRPEDSGLRIQDTSIGIQPSTIVSTDRVFLTQSVVDVLQPKARYLAYFVNSLGSIPYSFVTATDQLHGDETILTDYTARRLKAHVGDSVTMDYYVSRGALKQLETRSHRFRVSAIVPIAEFQQQRELLTADFPGLSGVERCTDWDSDLPVDMSRITPADEAYWQSCRQLPKALVSLDAVGSDWTGYYGVATKIVVEKVGSGELAAAEGLAAADSPLFTIHSSLKTSALSAAQNGTDFGTLFLALGFFIILSALLLMQNPLSEMYHLRRPEIQLLAVLGFSRRQVFRRLFCEALPVLPAAVVAGVLLGYAYAALILWLLSGPWSGATHTDGFTLHANPLTVLLALLVTAVLSLILLSLTIRSALKTQSSTLRTQPSKLCSAASLRSAVSLQHSALRYYRRQHRLSFWTMALGVLTVFAVGINHPDADHFSTEATGGYEYYAESRIPIPYDLSTPAARRHLHLDSLPAATRFLQLPRHTEDEASCLNLNRVFTPSVVGMPLAAMPAFGIDTVQNQKFKVFIDEEALLWSMMRQVGDTLTYHASDGREVPVVIAGTYPTGIFHGNAIMPLDTYRQLWPDELGTRIILSESERFALSSSLSDYGLAVTTTRDRLRMFFEVTDTYLRIFLSLGGIGLILGLASLLVFIRKNLAARRDEFRLYQTLGFTDDAIVSLLRREQLVVPLLAIVAGSLGALLSSLLIPITSPVVTPAAVALFVLMVALTWIIVHKSINSKTINTCEN